MTGAPGVSPAKLKLGANSQPPVTPLPRGTQGPGEPSANEGGQKLGGTGGRSPHDGGAGGVPHKNKIRGQ